MNQLNVKLNEGSGPLW